MGATKPSQVKRDQYQIEFAPGHYGCGDALIVYLATEFEDKSFVAEHFIFVIGGVVPKFSHGSIRVSGDPMNRGVLTFDWALVDARESAIRSARDSVFDVWRKVRDSMVLDFEYVFAPTEGGLLRLLAQRVLATQHVQRLETSKSPSLARDARAANELAAKYLTFATNDDET